VQQIMQNFTGDARDFIDYLEDQVHAGRQFQSAASPQPKTVASVLSGSTGGTP
jgi:phage-related minor tail protein